MIYSAIQCDKCEKGLVITRGTPLSDKAPSGWITAYVTINGISKGYAWCEICWQSISQRLPKSEEKPCSNA